MIDTDSLEKKLCEDLCAKVRVITDRDNNLLVDTPFTFPDGDTYQIYVDSAGMGMFKITDRAHTIMRMSYDFDIDNLYEEGRRKDAFHSVLNQHELEHDDGEIYRVIGGEEVAKAIVGFGQALTSIFDISTQTRDAVAQTFYDDVKATLQQLVKDKLTVDYRYPGKEHADYPIDYFVKTGLDRDLFVMGVTGKEKAQLATIVLQHFQQSGVKFESLVVVNDHYSTIPKMTFKRLTNVSGNYAFLDDTDALQRKILERIAA